MLEPWIFFLEASNVWKFDLRGHRLINFLCELRKPWRFFSSSKRVQLWQRAELLLFLRLIISLMALLELFLLFFAVSTVSRKDQLPLGVLSETRDPIGISFFLTGLYSVLIMYVSVYLHQITGRQIHWARNLLDSSFLLAALGPPVVDAWLPCF